MGAPNSQGRSFVAADPNKCTGCGVCQLVCALEKEDTFNPAVSRIKVLNLHGFLNLAVACRLCEDAPCVNACLREALRQDDRGIILVDEEKCNGCGWCVEACEYGAITLHPEKRVVIVCDLCGGEPKCVDWCPEGALELVSEDEFNRRVGVAIMNKLVPEAWRRV